MPGPALDDIRDFWERNPVADSAVRGGKTWYDYFRSFDNLRESDDVEPYPFSNRIHQYESSKGQWVLDYGCGNGYVLSQYARNGAHVVGVDLTERAIDLTRLRFHLMDLNGFFLRNDGLNLPFRSNLFDLVCCMGVLHHVPDPHPIVRELWRILKPGGKIIVMVYNKRSYRYHVTFNWQRLWGVPKFRGKTKAQMVCLNDGTGNPHGVVYTRDRLRALLGDFRGHSFIVNKLGLFEIGFWSTRLARILDWITPRKLVRGMARTIGWNLYASACKPDADGAIWSGDAIRP